MLGTRTDWPRRVAITAGVLVSALGAAVLLAWRFHFTPVIRMLPMSAPMHRVTALEFLLAGVALCLVSSSRMRADRFFAFAMLIPALLVSLEYLLKKDFGIDQFLGREEIGSAIPHPGRMSPVLTFCFLAASLSLLVMSSRTLARRVSGIVGVVASVIIAIGVITLIAYLGRAQADGWGYFRAAIPSAIGNALLGTGLVALAWQERPAKEGLPHWVPLSLGLGVAIAALGLWQALLTHKEDTLPLLSAIVLAGGFLLAGLLAVAVYQAQKAGVRNRELQEGKAKLEQLFEASPDALVVTDGEGRITQANQRIETVFGYAPGELIGAPIERLVPEELRDLHRVHRGSYYSSPCVRPMGEGLDLRAQRKDGSEFPVEVHLSPLRLKGDVHVLEVVRDVTERKQAQEALRRSEERFRGVFETSPLGLALIASDYRLAKVNPSLCRMSGYSEAELTGANPLDLTHPDDRQTSMELAERLFKGEIPSYQVEKRYVKKNGEIIWADMAATIIRDREGHPLLGLGMVADITERRRAEEALRQSEERFRGVFEQGPIGLTLIGLDYRFVKVNEAFCRMLGYSEAELIMKMTPLDIVHPDDLESTVDRVERLFKTEAPIQNVEKRYVKKNGEVIWGCLNGAVIHDGEGKPLYAMGMIEDITERKRSENELRTLSQRLSQAIRFASMGVWEWDPRANSFAWDDTTFELSGIPKVVPLPYEEWARTVHPDDLPDAAAALLRVVQEKTQESMEFRIIRPDGDFRYAYAAGGPILDQQGSVVRVVGIVVDITERKRAEEELRTLSERLSLATQIASIGVWDWDLHTDLGVWDDATFEIFGLPKANPVRHEDFVRRVHPDDLPHLEAATQRVIRNKTQEWVELRITRPDGSLRQLSVAEGAVVDEEGHVTRIVGIALDITDRKQMEAKIEASREQMIASARLSALGMMAGGIAHEINNPLAIIHAMASDLVEMVEEEGSAPPATVVRKSAIIRDTAGRIARIVKSLRRISREGSSDKLHATPLAKILEETLEISRERFRANGVALLVPDTVPDVNVACREVQIGQALLNLLQNAFDAVVDQQGERWVRLEVEAREDSVAMSVTDNGPGIPAELRSRIMEPFFTTKEIGKGTGLGLSLSKTIAEEHGGKLEYGEAAGHTRFSLVLPQAKEEAEAA